NITCSDEDFNNSVRIASTYMQHVEVIYNSMEGNKEKLIQSNKLKSLCDVLPNQFDRKTAVELAARNSIHVSDRTVDNYLKRLVADGMLEYSYNKYQRKSNRIALATSQKTAA